MDIMPISRTNKLSNLYLARLYLTFSFFLLVLLSPSATSAEEELFLLTIEGDLLGTLEILEDEEDAAVILNAYYALLPEEVQASLISLRHRLTVLIPDYEVAYTATDSAELSEVMDDIDVIWGEIKIVHAQKFTSEVVEVLNTSFSSLYSVSAQLN